jgi:hypothetical protein
LAATDAADDITIIILLIGEASGVFAGFCPSWFTVSSPFFHEQEAREGNVKRIRWGEAAATAIVLATGAAVSYRTKQRLPFIAAAAICAVFVGGYEYMIANPSSEDQSTKAQTPWMLPKKED